MCLFLFKYIFPSKTIIYNNNDNNNNYFAFYFLISKHKYKANKMLGMKWFANNISICK